jgi:integrase
MATINLYLNDRPDRQGNRRVMLIFQHRGKYIKKYIGLKVPEKQWDGKHQRVRAAYPNATMINSHLAAQKESWNTELLKLKLAGSETDTEQFRHVLERNEQHGIYVADAMTKYLKSKEATHSDAFTKKYRTLYSDWQAFEAEQDKRFRIEDVQTNTVEAFASYLLTTKGNTNNTVAKKQGFIKTFLYWAVEEGLLTNAVPKIRKVKSRKARHVAVTEAELRMLESCHLATPTLEKVRDVFVFACYTGLRYSDLANMKPENVVEQVSETGEPQRYLRITMIKTREKLTLPLSPSAYEILQRYHFKLPVISLQKSNDYMKEVGQVAGINQPVQQVRYRGSERLETTKPKYEMLTSHAARRTFATLSAMRGMNLVVLQRLLGHSDIQQTMDYIMETETVNTEEMKRVWGR